MSRKEFVADTLFNATATVMVSLGALGVSVVCARYYGADTFGKYAFALSVVVPVFVMGGFNLRQLASSYPDAEFDAEQFDRVQVLGLALSLLVCLLIAFAIYATNGSEAHVTAVVLVVTILKLVDTAAEGRFGHLAREKRFRQVASRKTQRALLTVSAFCLCTTVNGSFLLSLLAMTSASAALLAIHDGSIWLKRTSAGGFFAPPAKSILGTALVSGAAASMDSLAGMLPRIALGAAQSYEALGHYTAAMQIPLLFAIFVGALGNAAIPRWRQTRERRVVLKSLLLIQSVVALLVASLYLLAYFLGDWLLAFVYGDSFSNIGWILRAVVVGSAFWFLAGINGCALQAFGAYRWQLAATIGAVLVMFLTLAFFYLQTEEGVVLSRVVTVYVLAMFVRFGMSTVGVLRSVWQC